MLQQAWRDHLQSGIHLAVNVGQTDPAKPHLLEELVCDELGLSMLRCRVSSSQEQLQGHLCALSCISKLGRTPMHKLQNLHGVMVH